VSTFGDSPIPKELTLTKVDTIIEEDEFAMEKPKTTKAAQAKKTRFNLRTIGNSSPIEKFEARMLERSLESKLNHNNDQRECCKRQLKKEIKKI